jgi:carboxymethylenebutenolidase
MRSIDAEGAAERDAAAFVAWPDAQPQVDRTRKIGTQGYCMGGALVVRTAAALPNHIGAGASFHGGGS